MGKIDWPRWNKMLNHYSYLYLVGSISATSLNPILATLLCLILFFTFHLQTVPEAKRIFSRHRELIGLQDKTGLTSEEIAELRELLKERNTLTDAWLYFLSTITSLVLFFYNVFRLFSSF